MLDLRANGGGLVEEARLIASIFIQKGTIVSTRGRTQPSETLTAAGDAISPSIPLVVLVDQQHGVCRRDRHGALQDHHRATVVGTHTFGKGVFQEEEPLANGGALDITVGRVLHSERAQPRWRRCQAGRGHHAGSARAPWRRLRSRARRRSQHARRQGQVSPRRPAPQGRSRRSAGSDARSCGRRTSASPPARRSQRCCASGDSRAASSATCDAPPNRPATAG